MTSNASGEVVAIKIVQRASPRGPKMVGRSSDIFIDTADGRRYYTRLWYEVPDSPFARAEQIEQFKRRREAAARARTS